MHRKAEAARKAGLFEPGAAQTARSRGPVVAAFDPALQQVRPFSEVWRAHRDTEE